ncbi:GNAT family N-acetyltransferase [Georgenia faecalis]|uniref:GNAT family N-acetyltransferase n=1 Tax=Georgenia faecalis TaxID=2483799 RepID=A0ABV9DC81_9MICO|nr:GNAT family N-acetyltransferase [Georgenia faecalis]
MPSPLADRAAAPDHVELPAAHLGLTWRPLEPGDADAVLALARRCEAVDTPILRVDAGDVESVLARPERGIVADSLGGFDSAGELRASAFVYAPPGDESHARVFIDAAVDPEWRGRGIGRALLAWQDGRARQMLAQMDPELPGRIAAYVDEHHADRRRLYAAAGFSPKRVYRDMRRNLRDPIPPVEVPEGMQIVSWTPDLDERVRLTHNEAFADHWGSQPVAAESWTRIHRDLVPEWSMVALAGDDIAGYALTSRHEHQWEALGHTEGFTELLGVRRPYRGTGVARALLTAVLEALHRDGLDMAALDVDTENPSGAHHFYERMGYEPQASRILYTIEL